MSWKDKKIINTNTCGSKDPGPKQTHLVCSHRRQLAHVDVQDVVLQPAGRLAAALQDLSGEQLQEPGDNTDREDTLKAAGDLADRAPPALTCCPSWSSSAPGRFV